MSNPAFDMTTISVLEPTPVIDLRAEIAKFDYLPAHLLIGQASKVLMLTPGGAAKLHDRCEKVSAGRDECGNRIFRLDGCIGYRWCRLTYFSSVDQSEQETWPDD